MSGTAVQQWSGTSTDNNLNQLFKITLVESRVGDENLNYYVRFLEGEMKLGETLIVAVNELPGFVGTKEYFGVSSKASVFTLADEQTIIILLN